MKISTPDGTFTIRLAEADDEPKILELWAAAFGRRLDPQIWRWKYSGPLGQHTTICQAPDGRLAAIFPTVPLQVRLGGGFVRWELAMDSASHPAFRDLMAGRSGLFARTAQAHFARAAALGTACLYGFPGVRHLRLGQRTLAYLPLATQPVFFQGHPKGRCSWLGLRLTPWSPPDPGALAALDARLGPAEAVVRHEAWVAWRFFSHPQRPYRVWQLRSPLGRMRGALVSRSRGDWERVVDLFVPPDLAAAALLALARESGRGVEVWLSAAHPALAGGLGVPQVKDPIGAVAAVRPIPNALPPTALTYTLADTDVDHHGN